MELGNSDVSRDDRCVQHRWTINDFPKHMLQTPAGVCLESSTFQNDVDDDSHDWTLRIYPNGSTAMDPGKVAVYLCMQGAPETKVEKRILFKLCYLEPNGRECYGFFQAKTFVKDIGTSEHSWGFWTTHANLLQYGILNDDDSVNILCTIYESSLDQTMPPNGAGSRAGQAATAARQAMQQPSRLNLQTLEQLFRDARFTDCKLVADDVTMPAHRLILVCSSPVFDAMLQGHWKESNGEIRIEDCSATSIRHALEYVYGGAVPQGEEDLKELLPVADKYMLHQLKRICDDKLTTTVTSNNALQRLLLAEMHDAPMLRRAALRLVRAAWPQIRACDDWQTLMKNGPRLAAQLLSSLLDDSPIPRQTTTKTD